MEIDVAYTQYVHSRGLLDLDGNLPLVKMLWGRF